MELLDATDSPSAASLAGVAAGCPMWRCRRPVAPGRRRWWPGTGGARRAASRRWPPHCPCAAGGLAGVYLGLPMTGARGPAGGRKEVVRPGTDGQVLSAGPMVEQAVAGFPAVVAALRERLPVDDGPIGLLDGSLGAVAVWLDVVAWADQIAARDSQPALLVTGAGDRRPRRPRRPRAGRAAGATLASRYRDPSGGGPGGRAGSGIDAGRGARSAPAPRTAGAALVDAAVADWWERHLIRKEAS